MPCPCCNLGMKPPKYLKEGDMLEFGIDGLGQASQQVVSWDDM